MASMPATITGDTMPSPTRGFASATAKRLDGVNPVTLTSYIWESLGNPIPTEIYNTVADTIAPTVTAFIIPASSSTLAVPITTFTATDYIAVTAYMITETASAPTVSDAGWLVSPPASFTFVSSGSKTLYAWAKDAAGHVSASRSANVVVTVADTVAPTVTALATPSSSSTLLVPNIAFMASDNVGVTGYMLNETAAAPTSSASGWVPAPPTSYTFATAGTKTLYARAKDAAGNISSAVSAAVLVDLSQPAGNTYYLDPAGVDTNPCSQALPCRQLAKVLPLVVAGDSILLADGTYAGANVTVTGTAQSPISIKASGKNAVISARANVRGNLYLNNCAYVVVDGIRTSGGTGSLAAGIAVRFSNHVTVKNSTTFNNYVWGIFVSNSPNIILENNESYGQTTQHGIYVADATASHDQPVIRGNKLHDNAMNGLHMNGDNGGTGYFTGAVIENNTIYNNTLTGINMDGVQSSIIRNNLLYNNHGSGIAMYQTDAVTGPAGNQVLNNTIDMASNSKWAIRHTGSVGVSTFRNNILYNRNLAHGGISTNSATDVINTDSDYNIFAGSNYAATPDDEEIYLTLAQWQTAGKDVHSLNAAPGGLFMNVGVDYHLAAASPAIDRGQTLALVATDMDGNDRPNGVAFDIGSFEVVKVSDSIAPDVTSFSMPATATSLTVAVSTFSATDAVGVTAYLITESSSKPAVTAAGWTATAPVSFSFASAGSRTAYAWARDAAGNISLSRSAIVAIDMAAPVVSAFSMPATATSLTVAVTSFTASDSAGITGYLITENPSVPSAAAAGWTLTAPTSFTFSSAGSKTAYAWARDPAGNVSLSRSTVVAIDTASPVVSMLVRKNNASISGALSVSATAFDNVAVSRVEFYVNETLVATLTAAPYVYNWDSTTGVSGANALRVKAFDAAGNMGQSNTVKMIRPSCQVR
jgi:parallel beta-helix repeat protein